MARIACSPDSAARLSCIMYQRRSLGLQLRLPGCLLLVAPNRCGQRRYDRRWPVQLCIWLVRQSKTRVHVVCSCRHWKTTCCLGAGTTQERCQMVLPAGNDDPFALPLVMKSLHPTYCVCSRASSAHTCTRVGYLRFCCEDGRRSAVASTTKEAARASISWKTTCSPDACTTRSGEERC